MKTKSALGLLLAIWLWSPTSLGEKTCGEAKIIAGSSCSSLRVQFFLESCGANNQEAKLDCDMDRASAVVSTEAHTYHIPLREIAPGVWSLVGAVREYPKNWKPEAYNKGSVVFRAHPSIETNSSWPSVFEVGGQFRFRTEQNKQNDFASDRGFSSLRARAGLYFRPNPSIEFMLEPQAVQVFGEPSLQPVASNVNVSLGTSGSNRDPQLSFHQAFGEIHVTPSWRFVLGRQTLALGDEVLVGASDWENPGRSFDGIRSRVEWNKSSWDLFSTKLWDKNTQNSGQGDSDFHGSYLVWTSDSLQLSFSPYFFWLRDHRASLSQLFTSGVHTSVDFDGLTIRTEASGQWGESSGQQIWSEFKSKPLTQFKIQVGIDAFWSSVDFNPLFPTTHKWLGWADVLGRRNLSGLGFQIGGAFLGNNEWSLRGLHFLKTNTDFPAYQVDGTTPIDNSDRKNQTLGSEIDVIAKSRLLPGLELAAAGALFFPAESLKNRTSEPWLGRFEVSLISSF